MSKEEWFRNTKWNKEIEDFFELKLKRARGSHSKSQYLRIQASYLLNSLETSNNKKGIDLMNRLIEEFPEETYHIAFGKEQLGDYYLNKEEYQKAEQFYKEVTQYYYENNRSGTSGIADIKLSRTILESKQKEKFEEALIIATIKFDESNGNIIMNNNKFYYAETLALLFKETNRLDKAKVYAKQALNLEADKEPQFSRHKTVGIVNASNKRIIKLKEIVNE